MEKQKFHLVSFSGGKDSTAMLLMMLEKDLPIDMVVFCDTGMEFPDMYAHIEAVENVLVEKRGIGITRLKAEKGFEYWFSEHVKTRGKNKGKRGYGWPSMRIRWCTDRLKTGLIERELKELFDEFDVVEYVAIAADESERVKDKVYPLVEWGITEKEALEYCYSKGFDWNGLYEKFDRVSCWCCPLSNLKELKVLHDDYPELWCELQDMDERAYNDFKRGWSVAALTERFENS